MGSRRATVARAAPRPDPASLAADWQRDAACGGTDVEQFFPASSDDIGAIVRFCTRCRVRTPCLAYAVATGERFGIWGGRTPRERMRIPEDERVRLIEIATTGLHVLDLV